MLRGRDAQELAEALFRIVGAERQRALRDVVLAWLPWANVDDVQLASTEGSWQVSLRADVSVSGYAQLEGQKTWLLPGMDSLHWAWPRARVSSLAATFASRAGRESALAVSTAVQYHVHRRVELPKGATVARMPGPLDVKSQAGRGVAQADGERRRQRRRGRFHPRRGDRYRPGGRLRRVRGEPPTPPTTAFWPRCDRVAMP